MIIDLDKKITNHLQIFPHISIKMERWTTVGRRPPLYTRYFKRYCWYFQIPGRVRPGRGSHPVGPAWRLKKIRGWSHSGATDEGSHLALAKEKRGDAKVTLCDVGYVRQPVSSAGSPLEFPSPCSDTRADGIPRWRPRCVLCRSSRPRRRCRETRAMASQELGAPHSRSKCAAVVAAPWDHPSQGRNCRWRKGRFRRRGHKGLWRFGRALRRPLRWITAPWMPSKPIFSRSARPSCKRRRSRGRLLSRRSRPPGTRIGTRARWSASGMWRRASAASPWKPRSPERWTIVFLESLFRTIDDFVMSCWGWQDLMIFGFFSYLRSDRGSREKRRLQIVRVYVWLKLPFWDFWKLRQEYRGFKAILRCILGWLHKYIYAHCAVE